ncbi:MAG: GTPase HflX [Clostridia bacterium]|nr:GTPase HflX [Clostridia bacterium]
MEQTNIFRSEEAPRAVLVSVITPDMDQQEAAVSLDELEKLLETAGGTLFAQVIQQRQTPVAATYIGTGKLEEIKELCQANDIHLVVFDCELSPAQIKNIENALEDGKDDFEVRVIDRSMLILDIFALHATTGEGKLQVELAQLRYTIPRLIGRGTELSRLGGGIGTRGPGESKLETDRRHVQRRIAALEAQIAEMDANRQVQRSKRERSGILKVAIVGYTNAGKSTLLNRLTDAGILAENKLFATLDPTTRKFALPSGREILLTDTVGFIRNLPHHLIRAFRSTLEEAKFADAILILVDASDPEADSQLEVTEKLLYDLGAADKPILYVFNKCDVSTEAAESLTRLAGRENVVAISALDGRGVPDLVDKLELLALGGKRMCVLMIPMNKQGLIAQLYAASAVEDVEYLDNGVRVVALLDEKLRGRFKDFIVE